MWDNKLKAITFSFDDGCEQDKRLISLLNKYNLIGTFNLNSGLFGLDLSFPMEGKMIDRHIVKSEEVHDLYLNHEVAVHSLHHPDLTKISDEEVKKELIEDQKNLSKLVGYDVVGMAYPGGGYTPHLIDLIKENTNIKYARPATCPPVRPGMNIPKALYEWHQYYWLDDHDYLDKIIDEFLNSNPSEPQVFTLWGHSYELDAYDDLYDWFEKFCQKISNRSDIYYASNKDILFK